MRVKPFRLTRKLRQNPELVEAERERRAYLHQVKCNRRIPNLLKYLDSRYEALAASVGRHAWVNPFRVVRWTS